MTRPRWRPWSALGLVVVAALVVAMMVDLSRAVTAGKDRLGAMEATYPSFLPLVRNEPTLTPSITPTPPPTPTPSLTPTASATHTPSPTATPTGTLTATPPPATSGDISIVSISYRGSGSNEPDEYVEIRNNDSQRIELSGWSLQDTVHNFFHFPSYIIQPEQVCRVYTNQDHADWCGFSYGSETAIWNNGGDCAWLHDSAGTTVDSYCYWVQK